MKKLGSNFLRKYETYLIPVHSNIWIIERIIIDSYDFNPVVVPDRFALYEGFWNCFCDVQCSWSETVSLSCTREFFTLLFLHATDSFFLHSRSTDKVSVLFISAILYPIQLLYISILCRRRQLPPFYLQQLPSTLFLFISQFHLQLSVPLFNRTLYWVPGVPLFQVTALLHLFFDPIGDLDFRNRFQLPKLKPRKCRFGGCFKSPLRLQQCLPILATRRVNDVWLGKWTIWSSSSCSRSLRNSNWKSWWLNRCTIFCARPSQLQCTSRKKSASTICFAMHWLKRRSPLAMPTVEFTFKRPSAQ